MNGSLENSKQILGLVVDLTIATGLVAVSKNIFRQPSSELEQLVLQSHHNFLPSLETPVHVLTKETTQNLL